MQEKTHPEGGCKSTVCQVEFRLVFHHFIVSSFKEIFLFLKTAGILLEFRHLLIELRCDVFDFFCVNCDISSDQDCTSIIGDIAGASDLFLIIFL